jgi:hypothetical protein
MVVVGLMGPEWLEKLMRMLRGAGCIEEAVQRHGSDAGG